jgi:hypothetical protein
MQDIEGVKYNTYRYRNDENHRNKLKTYLATHQKNKYQNDEEYRQKKKEISRENQRKLREAKKILASLKLVLSN